MKILLIEDDADLRDIVVRSLRKERYVVDEAPDCATARTKLAAYEYDCVLLDIMLPDCNGLDILRAMPDAAHKTNVIVLSAKDSVEDKVAGLELGADDYLAKPFHLSELNARIRSVLRRKGAGYEQKLGKGNVTVYPRTFTVEVDGVPLELGRKEYEILNYFMNRPGRMVTKQTLAEAVWGDYTDVADNYDFVYAQMKNLRKRLRAAGADIEIKTIYGFGYKLVEI